MERSPYDAITGEAGVQDKISALREPLRQVPLFRDLSPEQLDLMARLAQQTTVQPDTVLVQQDAVGNELSIIQDGEVRVERNGREIARMGPGHYFGEMSLIDGKPRSATVVADTPTTLIIIQKHAFDHLVQSTPGLKDHLLVVLSGRLRSLQETHLD